MKRSKKPLTFAGIAATIGALSIAVEGCVYGPPPETNVYGPPPDDIYTSRTIDETDGTKPEASKTTINTDEVCVYGPPPDETMDGPETDVYGPPPDVPEITDGPEVDVYGPPVEDIED